MIFSYRGAKILTLSLIMMMGYVNGASILSSSNDQNSGPNGVGALGAFQIKFPGNNLLALMATAKVDRHQNNKTFIDYLPWSTDILGEEFAVTSRQAVQSPRVRTVDNFLSILQRNKKWQQPPLQTSFWRNFLWAGRIPLALLCGIYKLPYIKDMDARKRAFLAGCAAVVGLGFACKGLWRFYVPSAQIEAAIISQAIEQHNRFIDDKKILFADIIERVLKEPIQGDNVHTYIQQLGTTTQLVNNALDHLKVNNWSDNQPRSDILQEVRTVYLQAQAPAHRAYVAGGLIGGLGSLCAVHQLGGFTALHQLLKK
jgi:hypothetical protein